MVDSRWEIESEIVTVNEGAMYGRVYLHTWRVSLTNTRKYMFYAYFQVTISCYRKCHKMVRTNLVIAVLAKQ